MVHDEYLQIFRSIARCHRRSRGIEVWLENLFEESFVEDRVESLFFAVFQYESNTCLFWFCGLGGYVDLGNFSFEKTFLEEQNLSSVPAYLSLPFSLSILSERCPSSVIWSKSLELVIVICYKLIPNVPDRPLLRRMKQRICLILGDFTSNNQQLEVNSKRKPCRREIV